MIRCVKWFEDLLFAVCAEEGSNKSWVLYWKGAQECGKFEVGDLIESFTITREDGALRVWMVSSGHSWWTLDIHPLQINRGRVQQVISRKKKDALLPVLGMNTLETQPYLVMASARQISVRKLPTLEKVCVYQVPEGWACVQASPLKGDWGVAAVLEQSGIGARVVLLPLVDLNKQPSLFESKLFNSDPMPNKALPSRWRFCGGVGSVLYCMDATGAGMLTAVSSYGSEFFFWSFSADMIPCAVTMAAPDVKMPEKPKGWLAGVFSSDPDEIGSLFASVNTPLKPRSGTASSSLSSSSSSVVSPTRNQASEVRSVMEQNIQKLDERGERLNEMEDKSDELAQQSNDFLANVERLRKKQEKKIFGIF